MPIDSFSRRYYRPALIERPSITQFVVLSVLVHILAVTLFGDASGVGRDGRGGASGTTFMATLRPLTASGRPRTQPTKSTASATARLSTPPAISNAAETQSSDPTGAETTLTEPPAVPAPSIMAKPIEPLPVIAVEVETPKGGFVVPNLTIAPIQAPVSTAGQVIVPIPGNDEKQPAPRSDRGFAMFVPTINEPAMAVEPARLPFATPILQAVPTVQSTKSLARFTPPSPSVAEPTVAPMPTATALVESAVLPTVESVPVASEQPARVLPITPLERINIQPATARALDTYVAPATAIVAPTASNESSVAPPAPRPPTVANQTDVTANTISTGGTVENNQRASAAEMPATRNEPNRGAAQPNSLSPGLSSLLPVVPTPRTAAPSSAPKLDLDSLRQRARELSAEGAGRRTLLPFPTVAQEAPKRNIEKIFDKALSRPNCKDEYANLGLAAVVPLVRDAVKGDGCKW